MVKERLAANAKFATILGSIPASSDTEEYDGRHEAVLNNVHKIVACVWGLFVYFFFRTKDLRCDCAGT